MNVPIYLPLVLTLHKLYFKRKQALKLICQRFFNFQANLIKLTA